ncbi:MAG TPA: nuclear transport factor 2 family protein [Candidatus Cloacimonadota bacterium]|nr:nuclear transport factor 2 family protein [Candidatus Cloacimonadota bacterium]HPT71686.1 nuclear transport factor 2 family protein [Candidatus Cloacimonadota bacterium]
MRRVINLLLLTALLILINSCDISKPKEVNKAELEQIINQMQTDFRNIDLPGIMSFYHPDYFHNGQGLSAEQTKWQNRLSEYSSFEFTNPVYDINDDRAVVSGSVKWHAATQTYITNEPDDNGDFSYFIKENGVWRIYGNQQVGRTTE